MTKQINIEAKTKLTKARIAMIMKQPFFGTLALRLQLVEDDTLVPETLAVDGKTIYYHPKWVLENDFDVVCAGIAHEVGHCVFDHIGRRNGREPQRWNYAGDYVINAILKDCGFTLGEGWLYSASFANQSTDDIYQQLPPTPPGSGGPGTGGQFDKHLDKIAQGSDPSVNADEWKVATVQAANAAKQHGSLPDTLKRFVDEMIQGKADWRAVLRRFMTETSRDDYSYARVNRKFAAIGIFLPGLYSETMGQIVTVVDTSGSISLEVLKQFGGEISEIRNQVRPSLTRVMYCDAAVNHVDEFEQYDEFKVEPHGGGGTDFRPPFDWLSERGIVPACAAYLTDGYGPFPEQPPEFPVLWLMTTDVVPPWGEVVRIEL